MNQIKVSQNNNISAQRLSFLQLIEKYNVVIPVIQRDYAQGRKTEKPTEVRKGFVRNLISYLQSDKIHDLDFVYGTVLDNEFIPLDGQQRLTTLFLLHLYIASKSNNYEDFVGLMIRDERCRFEYKTRLSSTMFCKNLLTHKVISPNSENKCDDSNNTLVTLQEKIKDQGWFFLTWLNDPTVAGMLVMLDEIDEQFSKKGNFDFVQAYEKLTSDKAPITFQMLPLEGYNRTDDLYIKLNARGIPLSDFENFKARLVDWMKDVLTDDKLLGDFKKKVDGVWNDYLWQFRNGKDNTDHIMENLFRNFIAYCYRPIPKVGQSNDAFIKQVNETMSYLLEQNGKKMRFSFSRYSELEVMPKENKLGHEKTMMEKVISFFNIYCCPNCNPIEYKGEWLDINNFVKNGMIDSAASYSQRLRLYAYLQYCNTHSTIDNDDINQWMRLIRNLDCATDIDTAGDFYRALVSIDDMLKQIGSEKVQGRIAAMSDDDMKIVKFFRSRQVKEECIKARLLIRESKVGGEGIKNAVELGDSDDYLRGQMGFALEFADAYDKFAKDEIKDMSAEEIKSLGDRISNYLQKTIKIKNILANNNNKISDTEKEETHLLERALLSLGMYLRKNSNNRYNFCNVLGDPYNSLKTLLHVEDGNEYCRDVFKKMLDKINRGSIQQIKQDLLKIIKNEGEKISGWRKLVIDNPSLIDYCENGFLYIEVPGDETKEVNLPDDDVKNVFLLGASQMNHYHAELWTRDLYERNKNSVQWSEKEPKLQYREEKKHGEMPVIYIEFTHNNTKYEFRLSHWDGIWKYQIINVNDENDSKLQVEFNLNENNSGDEILYKALEWINKKSASEIGELEGQNSVGL